jgi:hypothetical protein
MSASPSFQMVRKSWKALFALALSRKVRKIERSPPEGAGGYGCGFLPAKISAVTPAIMTSAPTARGIRRVFCRLAVTSIESVWMTFS